MVATTTRSLRKVLGRTQVEEEEIQTILVGIENTLNSRTIIQQDDSKTLTPEQKLTVEKLTTNPHGSEPVMTENMTTYF